MKINLVVSEIFLLLFISLNVWAQETNLTPDFITKEEPFASFDFRWNNRNNLDILIALNVQNDPAIYDEMIYHDPEKLVVEEIQGEFYWLNSSGTERSATIKAENIFKDSTGYVWVGHFRNRPYGLGNTLKGSDRWTRGYFNIHYSIDSIFYTTPKIPVYYDKTKISNPEESSVSMGIISLTKNKTEDEATLNLFASEEKTKIKKAFILNIADSTVIGESIDWPQQMMTGNNPKIRIKLKENVWPELNYIVKLDYEVDTMRNLPYWQRLMQFDVIPTFEVTKIELVETGEEIIRNRVNLNYNKNLKLRIYTNASAEQGYITNSMEVKFKILEETRNLLGYQEPIPVAFDKRGIGILDINLTDAQDGAYTLVVDEGNVKSKTSLSSEEIIDLSPLDPILIVRDTRNMIKSLRFDYTEKNYEISFGLVKPISANQVFAISNTNVKKEAIFDENSQRYQIEYKLEEFPKNALSNFILNVSGHELLEYEFYIMDKTQISQGIQNEIDIMVGSIPNKKRPSHLRDDNNTTILKEAFQKVINEKFASILEKSTPKEIADFNDNLNDILSFYVEYLANIPKDRADDPAFWNSSGDKLVDTIGGVALRYLGVVLG
ncbi:hypothetical protein [Flexithrix dorotheae]|uniref:hypothetical protein n=1 Tax=Flexithrix dorotheae TaxID=70993 RepID=UPI00036F24E7|nr:hypothetical protein [Flexithrix dorotheae]